MTGGGKAWGARPASGASVAVMTSAAAIAVPQVPPHPIMKAVPSLGRSTIVVSDAVSSVSQGPARASATIE